MTTIFTFITWPLLLYNMLVLVLREEPQSDIQNVHPSVHTSCSDPTCNWLPLYWSDPICCHCPWCNLSIFRQVSTDGGLFSKNNNNNNNNTHTHTHKNKKKQKTHLLQLNNLKQYNHVVNSTIPKNKNPFTTADTIQRSEFGWRFSVLKKLIIQYNNPIFCFYVAFDIVLPVIKN